MAPDIKTGQHIDIPKQEIIVPVLADFISDVRTGKNSSINFLDLGGGDSSTSLSLIKTLESRNIHTRAHALVDRDQHIFPDALGNIFDSNILAHAGVAVIQPDRSGHLGPGLESYENQFDIAVANLVLHQIPSQAELSLLMHRTLTGLRDSGRFYITELHPDFLTYLQENESEKISFEDSLEGSSEGLGKYIFDSGGSVRITKRTIQDTLASAIGVGFNLARYNFPSLKPIENYKPRYAKLIEKGIPMFYIMELQKNPQGFISSSEGIVSTAKAYGAAQMRLDFVDGEFVIIPISNNIDKIHAGDRVVLSDILLPDKRMHLNMWVIPNGQNEPIWSSQWSSKNPI